MTTQRLLTDGSVARGLVRRITDRTHAIGRTVNLMEVCGTHTVAISKAGLRQVLPPGVRLISGPGCPVCVTDQKDIDMAIALVQEPGVILATFGDMMRVPGSESSLAQERAGGRDVRIVYSPLDALTIARENPSASVIFYAVGFETTAPMVAAALELAVERDLANFCIYSVHKTVPPALAALVASGQCRIEGFLMPGHVSAVIGATAYRDVALKHRIPAVVTGFDGNDILLAIDMLLAQVEAGEAKVEIEYSRAVSWEGNRTAQEILVKFFQAEDAVWRGLGAIPGSGLALRPEFARFDATKRFDVARIAERLPQPGKVHAACACGAILQGVMLPPECALFGRACTPVNPVGPCMVSSEGSCAAYYRYERGVGS